MHSLASSGLDEYLLTFCFTSRHSFAVPRLSLEENVRGLGSLAEMKKGSPKPHLTLPSFTVLGTTASYKEVDLG